MLVVDSCAAVKAQEFFRTQWMDSVLFIFNNNSQFRYPAERSVAKILAIYEPDRHKHKQISSEWDFPWWGLVGGEKENTLIRPHSL